MAGVVALALPAVGQGDRPARMGLLGALDRNGNGKLEAEEIDLAVVSLRKLDRNKDGEVTREEIFGDRAAGAPSDRRRPRVPDFSSFDKDGDGKISKEEAPERMLNNFERLDRNGDGFFDKEEQAELIKMIRERAGGRPGQPRPGRPEPGDGQGGTDKPKRPAPKDD